jgi:cell wall-associated NlpC family hydrolase
LGKPSLRIPHPQSLHLASHTTRISALIAAGLALGVKPVAAQDHITLELPPSEAARAVIAAQTVTTTTTPQREVTPRGLRGFAQPSRGARRQSIVGKLGQLVRRATVYRQRSSQSSPLTQAPPGTYVAVEDAQGGWYGILMADGSEGWVTERAVKPLEYQVVSTGTVTSPAAVGAEAYDDFPRTATPYFTGDPQMLLNEAYRYLGVRYVWGGNTANGIDCSGFVKNVFERCGFPLPRLGSDQMAYGIAVPPDQLQPGDRLYFGRRKERHGVTHTGLYIGNGYFIHSSSSKGGVAISQLSESMYARIFVCARR